MYNFQTDGIVNYMKKQAGPDSVLLQSEHDLENFINNFDASVVGKCVLLALFELTLKYVIHSKCNSETLYYVHLNA